MLSEITVSRDFQIVAGYVQVPPNFENGRDAVSDKQALVTLNQVYPPNDDARIVVLSLGSGRPTGSGFGGQRILRLPAVAQGPGSGPPSPDPAALLAPIAPAQPAYPA